MAPCVLSTPPSIGIQIQKEATEKLDQRELELKHYEERLRLREVAVSEKERRLDGECIMLQVFSFLINKFVMIQLVRGLLKSVNVCYNNLKNCKHNFAWTVVISCFQQVSI